MRFIREARRFIDQSVIFWSEDRPPSPASRRNYNQTKRLSGDGGLNLSEDRSPRPNALARRFLFSAIMTSLIFITFPVTSPPSPSPATAPVQTQLTGFSPPTTLFKTKLTKTKLAKTSPVRAFSGHPTLAVLHKARPQPVPAKFARLCRTFYGAPVRFVSAPRLKDVGAARLDRRAGALILLNPKRLARLNPKTQIFIMAHECGHHALGHTAGIGRAHFVERDADCWAITTLTRNQHFSRHDIAIIQHDMERLSLRRWKGNGIRARAERLLNCLRNHQAKG